MGFWELFIAVRIASQLNAHFYPAIGAASVETMIYCFDRTNHGRRPDVIYISRSRYPDQQIPGGDIHIPPDLVVEVLSPANTGIEVQQKIDEYLAAGVKLVWIVNPADRTIRVYRDDGTTRGFRDSDTIQDEPLLPGLRLRLADVFPAVG